VLPSFGVLQCQDLSTSLRGRDAKHVPRGRQWGRNDCTYTMRHLVHRLKQIWNRLYQRGNSRHIVCERGSVQSLLLMMRLTSMTMAEEWQAAVWNPRPRRSLVRKAQPAVPNLALGYARTCAAPPGLASHDDGLGLKDPRMIPDSECIVSKDLICPPTKRHKGEESAPYSCRRASSNAHGEP
jgi:hypothetical protein